MAKLHIELIQKTESEKNDNDIDVEYQAIEGKPFINGRSLLKEPYSQSLIFDLLYLLVVEDTDTTFDLYTCSCGAAGCAGIFEKVHLVSTTNTVAWKLPAQFYAENSDFTNDGLIFDKQEYLQELQRIKLILLKINETSKLSIIPATRDVYDCIEENTLSEYVVQRHQYFLQNLQYRKEYEERYGDLLNYDLQIDFPSQTWTISLAYLADSYAESLGYQNDLEHEQYINDTIKPLFLNPQTDLSIYINQIGITATQEIAMIEYKDVETRELISKDYQITTENLKIIKNDRNVYN